MISENAAAAIWAGEMVLGVVLAAAVLVTGVRRFRRARSRATRLLAGGSVLGGLLGLVAVLLGLAVVYTTVALPSCSDPGTTAEFCETRTSLVRLLLVTGQFPLILTIGIPLAVDWLAKRALADDEAERQNISDLSEKQDRDMAQQDRIERKIDDAAEGR